MSEIKALERLRTAARNMAKGRNLENHEECNLLLIIANEIEAEIEREWMRLPVDAEGEPWHIGDVTENRNMVNAITFDRFGAHFTGTVNDIDPSIHVHFKPRTLEDVLQELEGLRGYGNSTYEDVVTRAAELADEIRAIFKEVDHG